MRINSNITIINLYIFLPFIGFISYNILGFGPEIILLSVLLFIMYNNLVLEYNTNVPRYAKIYSIFAVAVFFSKYFIDGQNLAFDANFRNYLILVSVLLSMILFENITINKNHIRKIIQYLKLLIVVSLIVSFIQYFNEDFFLNKSLLEKSEYSDIDFAERRILSIFSWVTNINLMVFSLPIILNIILGWEYITYDGKIKSYWIIAAVGMICILSQSRNFLLLYFIVVGYYMYKTFTLRNFLFFFSGLFFAVISMTLINFNFDNYLSQRLLSETYITRIDAFYAFIYTFPLNFFWGTGGVVTDELINFYGRQTRLHNGYLAIFYYYGLIGGITYLLYLTSMYFRLNKCYSKSSINISMITFICLAIGNLFVDYYVLFDIGLFMTILISNNLYNTS